MSSKLRNPHEALGDYLDEMLHQATEDARPQLPSETRSRVLLPDKLLREADLDSDRPEAAVDEPAPENAAATGAQTTAVTENPAAVEAEFPMQCLMFRVGGHLMSIPLVQLSSVVNWSDAITRLPQSPEWLLGMVKVRDTNLRVVDSMQLLHIGSTATHAPQQLLVLDDGGWAITCDNLEQVVNLEREDVQWRHREQPGMILGTIRDSLSTLLSPTGIARELETRGNAAAVE